MANENDNGGLYFVVGGLVVAVAVIGFLYFGQNAGEKANMTEPASGVEAPADNETSSTFNLEIDDNGISGSSTQTTDPDN
jgi:hypothetical protein